jgi:hypothetical protein
MQLLVTQVTVRQHGWRRVASLSLSWGTPGPAIKEDHLSFCSMFPFWNNCWCSEPAPNYFLGFVFSGNHIFLQSNPTIPFNPTCLKQQVQPVTSSATSTSQMCSSQFADILCRLATMTWFTSVMVLNFCPHKLWKCIQIWIVEWLF